MDNYCNHNRQKEQNILFCVLVASQIQLLRPLQQQDVTNTSQKTQTSQFLVSPPIVVIKSTEHTCKLKFLLNLDRFGEFRNIKDEIWTRRPAFIEVAHIVYQYACAHIELELPYTDVF